MIIGVGIGLMGVTLIVCLERAMEPFEPGYDCEALGDLKSAGIVAAGKDFEKEALGVSRKVKNMTDACHQAFEGHWWRHD